MNASSIFSDFYGTDYLALLFCFVFLTEWWNRGSFGSKTQVCLCANSMVSSGAAPQHGSVAAGSIAWV